MKRDGIRSYLFHDDYKDIHELFLEQDDLKRILEIIDRLDQRSKFVITRRFGIDCRPRTLQQISYKLVMSRERVRQIEVDVVALIRKEMSELNNEKLEKIYREFYIDSSTISGFLKKKIDHMAYTIIGLRTRGK